MSAPSVNFHPTLVTPFYPAPFHQFWINLNPGLCGINRTVMPERILNNDTQGSAESSNALLYNSGDANRLWKTNGYTPDCPPQFRYGTAHVPNDSDNLFSITNPNTLDFYASQFVSSDDASTHTEQQMNTAVSERHQRYQQRHLAQMKHPTGLPANYAMDTKMSLPSAPSSPSAGSLGSSVGSNYAFAQPHIMMSPAFGVPQYKTSSSSSYSSTTGSKISCSSMSSYSSRSSMSSNPSSNGISPRKRRAEDADCSKRASYLGTNRRDDSVILLRCSCDECATDEVTAKVDGVTIVDPVQQLRSKRSKNDDEMLRISSDSSSSKQKSRAARKIRKSNKKNKTTRVGVQNTATTDPIFAVPHSLPCTAHKYASNRYNLRSSARGRKPEELPAGEFRSLNVHMSQTMSPSTVAHSPEIDNNNNTTKVGQTEDSKTPRYHTRSRQKKTGVECQPKSHTKTAPVIKSPDMHNNMQNKSNTPPKNHLASVIRRVSSEAIRHLLSTPQSTPTSPVSQDSAKDGPKDLRSSSSLKRLYDIHGVIGVGGGGTVHAGTRKSDGIQVAIKQVPKAKVKRWGRLNDAIVPIEFELLYKASRSGHAGVIRMLDWYERRSAYILVMERPQPVIDLFDYLNQSGALPEATARNIFRQIARAILHCHANGVVHRDIKDENVLLNLHTSEAKLIDFGCGTVLKNTPYTEFAGTPEFYPPEWFTSRRYYGQRVDAWSLGVLLYTMVEAEVPFQKEKDIIECKLRHKRGEQLSESCKNLIAWMLQKDQDMRPTIEDVLRHEWFKTAGSEPNEYGWARTAM